jgi:hypothetical protein
MNFVVAPPNHRNDGVPEGDEIDQTLRAFFKAQMPDPWPSFEAPPSPSVLPFVPPQRSSALRRRLALAASVAVLAAGGWLLSGKFVDRTAVAEPEIRIQGSAHPDPDEIRRSGDILRNKPFLPVNPDGSVDSIKFVVPPPPGR